MRHALIAALMMATPMTLLLPQRPALAEIREPSPLELQAMDALDKGDLAQAESLFWKAAELDAGAAMARMSWRELLQQAGRHQEIEPGLRKLMAKFPNSASLLVELGDVYEDQGRAAEAETWYLKAKALNPSLSDAYHKLYWLWRFGSGRLEEAEQVLVEALAHNPTDSNARIWLATRKEEQGKLDEARRHFELAVQHDPIALNAWSGLGAVAVRQGKWDELERLNARWLAQAATESPADLLLMVANRLPDEQAAQKERLYRQAIVLAPRSSIPLLQLADLLVSQRRQDEALSLYQQAMRQFPAENQALGFYATLLFEMERWSQAEAAYRDLVGRQPDDANAYYSLAQACIRQNKKPEARKWLLEGLKRIPDDEALAEALEDLSR